MSKPMHPRESEELYRTLFDSIDQGFCVIEMIFDAAGRPVDYVFLEVNANFEKVSGIHDAKGKRILELRPKHEKRWFEVYGEVAVTGRPVRFEQRAGESGDRWFDLYAFRLGGGDSRRVAVIFRDVTERVNAAKALRESEERYRSLFNSMEEGFCVLELIFDERGKGSDFRIALVNPAFERQTGLVDAEGKRALEMSPQPEKKWAEIYGEVARTGRPAHFIGESPALGRFFEIRAARLDAEKKTVAVTFSNVTERLRAEEEIRSLNEELDAKVRERTRDLMAANNELESFCYSVSHDLRTPLRGIEGFTSLLEKDLGERVSEAGREYIERVRAATRRMSHIIDSLLELSRLSRGKVAIAEVDLSALAYETADETARSYPGRVVECRVAPGLRATGDVKLLRVALQNLLDNAWKFTEGRERAVVEVGAEEHGGRRAFFVRDDGAGFDMSFARKLFQPFERLHRVDEFPGTGIGLATVQRIIKRHGGEVWGKSEPGKGATFYFTLP